MMISGFDALKRLKEEGLRSLFPERTKVVVGMATCGRASGAEEVFQAIQEEVDKRNLDYIVSSTGCLGFCQREPLVDVIKPGWPRIVYAEMNAEKAREVIAALANGQILPQYALCRIMEEANLVEDSVRRYPLDTLPGDIEKIPRYEDVPFFSEQEKRILRNCGLINPDKIEEYIAQGGYLALFTALTKLKPDEIIDQVTRSGLRGRGGAGFPTGRKWSFCRQAEGDPKYIICNADEGDPGAYMDRSILEGNPHSVIEGMIIGAYAIGAKKGYIYVRAEYPLAIEKLKGALEQAQEQGFLGTNILGSGFDFSIDIERGSGAFVCGEETALIASIEGLTGEPRQRPPFPAQSGLWGKPTNINNVKTWANIPLIIARGADWFSKLGTDKSKGTMVFSLVGKVRNTGLVEVPMGTKLSSLVFDIGGGIADDRRLKAVQTGGPSGGCIPAQLAHLSADYETLTEAGSIMGSGGMVVMDEDTCMVDVAKYFLTFTRDESCGKCNPCREGIRRMLEILTDISEGRGQEGDIELLEEMATTIIDSSLCGLGGTAPNPVLTTIRYFRDEYEAHIKEKRCPAVVCKEIISSACQHTCPLGTDVPAYVTLIAKGEFLEAAKLIRKTNPLPNVCARVCLAPCERKCALGKAGEPLAIRHLKRFALEWEFEKGEVPAAKPQEPRYEKVAILGSGPAGLSAAYYLCQEGYDTTIFEALGVLGGMLAVAIPEYRLPRDILKRDIDYIINSGVKVETGVRVGRDLSIDDLFAQGYKAVLIATGCHRSLKLGIPGEDLPGVVDPLALLRQVKLGEPVRIGERVGVVGGGNTAIDVARVARRLGAKDVFILYRRERAEMPADPKEVEQALREGVRIEFLVAPTKVLSHNGAVAGVECLRMELGDFDQSGRRRPVPIKGSEFRIELDTLIPALGQESDASLFADGLQLAANGTIVASAVLSTTREGVFAAGDAVTGPATVTEAIAAGKLAAESIHKYLRGQPLEREYQVTRPSLYISPLELSQEEQERIADMERHHPAELPVEKRVGSFAEVEFSLSEHAAVEEAKRCLRCDLEVATKDVVAGVKRG